MNTMKKIVIASVTTATLFAGAAAFADRDHGKRHDRMVERVSERLELDPNQVAAFEVLQTEMLELREAMRGEQNVRQQLLELATADSFDQGAALALINERTALVNQQAPELVAAAAGFLDGLSAEQKAELSEIADRMGKRRGRHGDRHDHD